MDRADASCIPAQKMNKLSGPVLHVAKHHVPSETPIVCIVDVPRLDPCNASVTHEAGTEDKRYTMQLWKGRWKDELEEKIIANVYSPCTMLEKRALWNEILDLKIRWGDRI